MSMLENVIFPLFGVLQTIGIILYPLCWVLHEEWVWLEIPTQIFQHPLPAVTGECFTLFYFTQHKVSVTTWRALTNQLGSKNKPMLFNLTGSLLPIYLFKGPVSELACAWFTGRQTCAFLWQVWCVCSPITFQSLVTYNITMLLQK